MDWKFTHAADAAARIVIKNTLFSPFGIGRSKLSRSGDALGHLHRPRNRPCRSCPSQEARDRNIAVPTRSKFRLRASIAP